MTVALPALWVVAFWLCVFGLAFGIWWLVIAALAVLWPLTGLVVYMAKPDTPADGDLAPLTRIDDWLDDRRID